MIATSKGGYNNNATTYGMGGGYGRGSYGGGYTFKICNYCGKTGHTIDTYYKKHGFPSHFKFKNQNHNEQNHEGSKSEVQSQQIGFTPEHSSFTAGLIQ